MSKENRFYVTTAIDYANGSPHLGHAYEKVLTDVIARHRRLTGRDVHFLTGLDEHGQKVQQGAAKEGIEPQERCDRVAAEFQSMCRDLNISNDDYIRTTEPRHKEYVQELLQKLYDEGLIYKSEYKGFYSTRQEQFLQEKDMVEGVWPEIFGEVVEITEDSYFFKLAQYQEWLIEFLNNNEDFIYPAFRKKQVLEFLKEPLNDLCISRPVERLSWGIPLPFDSGFVTYVWFDALVNYISAVKGTDHWPADYHVIGKDIMVPPHAVYWPIMLKACGIELPKHLLVHGFWNISGKKMSKSEGTVVNPLELVEKAGADAFRYYVMREMRVGQDSDFSADQFVTRYNSELGNDLGNLLSRFLNMTSRYCECKVPAVTIKEEPEENLLAAWEVLDKEIRELFEGFLFHEGLNKIFEFIRAMNRYVEVRAPWQLAKSEDSKDQERLQSCLGNIAEGLRLAGLLIAPVMPTVWEKLQVSIGVDTELDWQNGITWGNSLYGKNVGEKVILFPRLEI
jgi:methionyl-tRNA synthetase